MASRDAWDATLKEELGVQFLPGQKVVRKRETRADASKKSRRMKSARFTAYGVGETNQKKIETRLERLECTNYSDIVYDGSFFDGGDDNSDSDDFVAEDTSSESEDISDDEENNTKKDPKKKKKKNLKRKKSDRGSKAKAKAKQPRAKKPKKKVAQVRTLTQVLLDEISKRTQACTSLDDLRLPDYLNAAAKPPRHPCLRLCVATNVKARYIDPESSLPYCNARAYESLKENPPQWVKATVNTPYHDAIYTMLQEREARLQQKVIQMS